MAENPRYQRANIVYADMPTLQPVDLQEQLQSNRRIANALDVMTNMTTDIAKRYAVEAAGKYTLENPITQDQLLEAQKTNTNPIAKDLKGGTIFNDTLKKVYAQQASSEFNQIAYTHFEDVLKQVENGTLTDPDAIKQSLNAIIKPQSQVLGNIDIETGVAYDAKATAYANTYFKQANKELERQAKERVDLLSMDTLNAKVKQFELASLNETDPVILQGLLNTHLADGYSTFKQGSHGLVLNEQLRQKLNYVLNNRFAEYMASISGSEANAMKMLEKNNAKAYTSFWKSKTAEEQDDLRQFVLKEIRLKNAGAEEFDRQYASKLKAAENMLKDGFEPDADTTKWLITNAGSLRPDSATRAEANMFNMKISESQKLNGMSIQDREAYEDAMLAKIGGKMTPDNYAVYSFVKDSNARFRDNIRKDMVGTMKGQTAYRGSYIDFGAQDNVFQDQVDNRIRLSKQFGNLNGVKPSFLDEGEVQALNQKLSSVKPDERIFIAGRIAKAFGGDAVRVFEQLSPKDPVTAHMGILFVNQTNDDILRRIAKGQEIVTSGYKPAEEKFAKEDVIKRTVGDSFYAAPQVYNNIVKTADVLYAEESFRKGYTSFDSNAYKEKLQEASGRKTGADGKLYGGVIKFNGNQLAIPSTIPQDDFDDLIDKASLNDFRYAADNFANRSNTNQLIATNNKEFVASKIKDAKFIPVNNNAVMLTIDDQPFLLKDGSPLYINLDVLYKKLKSEKRI